MRKFIDQHREKQEQLRASPVKTPSGQQPKLRGFTRAVERGQAVRVTRTERNRRRRARQ